MRSASPLQIVSAAMAAPAIVAALALVTIEGGRLLPPDPSLTQPPASASLADAIRHQSVEHAYAFIRAGQDPDAPIPFRDRELTGGRDVMVPPLLLAVASNRDNAVMMLLSFGARLDRPGARLAGCLARRLGHDALVTILETSRQGLPDVTCPPASGSEPPLLAHLE